MFLDTNGATLIALANWVLVTVTVLVPAAPMRCKVNVKLGGGVALDGSLRVRGGALWNWGLAKQAEWGAC